MERNIRRKIDSRLQKAASRYDLSIALLEEYRDIFLENGIPMFLAKKTPKYARRIVMVSTHGYWSDPPPAGVPDTGGQTYYVLEVSRVWARMGRKIIILARWFRPYARVESLDKNLWLVRIPAGSDKFVRKEDIYPLVPELAEHAVAVSALFGAHAVMGHYADGMAISVEAGERLGIPTVIIPHSLGINKVISLGFDPDDPGTWFDEKYNFGTRESYELAALEGANLEVANTLAEPDILREYYGKEFSHIVMPAGAGSDFFDIYKKPGTELLDKYGLIPFKYLIYFGRFSEAKNVPGVVALFGEAQLIDKELMKGIKLVLVGGSPENPQPEEVSVENSITSMMKHYGLKESDVVRLPSQEWRTLAVLAHHSLFYAGMQKMEPFGMGVAEAMAAGAPVIISSRAGIALWIADDREGVVVNPDDPHGAAERVVSLIEDEKRLRNMARRGNRLCRDTFSWVAIARDQGEMIDSLCQGKPPHGVIKKGNVRSAFTQRKGRAYHRLAFAWRGDPPVIRKKHKKAATELFPSVVRKIVNARKRKERVIVAIGGESGAGKTEIAEYLRFLLRKEKMWGVTIAGDAFFRLTPAENHKARLAAYAEGRLDHYLGPSEVDLEKLDTILKRAATRTVNELSVPSDCRRLGSRRYTDVPVDLGGIDAVFVDLTYSLLLKNVTLKVFLESDYAGRINEVRERNYDRDPDQDFEFIVKVLEIEHRIIQELRQEADFIVTADYEVTPV
jgi:glycosyltransferase involved in cell wall biosynthesis/uridine kinase